MKRTSQELYDYESKRIQKYLEEIDKIIDYGIDSDKTANRLKHLIKWYGNARAIKSKAYQELKKQK